MFKHITTINDVAPFVADKKEIRFSRQSNGMVIGCYQFMDSHTFDVPEALECRGIAFDEDGRVISRPLHKFFNMGEKTSTMEDALRHHSIAAIFDKLDGSMIATAWHQKHGLMWRSKKSFESGVVHLTCEMLEEPQHQHIKEFAEKVASSGYTAIFELTHPKARIVVDPQTPQLRLLHVRDNLSGAYVLLDPAHEIHQWVAEYNITSVQRFNITFDQALESLADMSNQEGYVVQLTSGDMVKIKCPWYMRFHRSVTFLRERDIARAALHEELDDIKNVLREIGMDLTAVEEVEARLKSQMLQLVEDVETVVNADRALTRKDFAIKNKQHPLFGLIMSAYNGMDPDYTTYYERHRLREEFGLRVLADEARAEELDMASPTPTTKKPFSP